MYSSIADATGEAKLVLGHFSIALNNPTTVLQQEQAKAFFANHDPSKLYQLIMEGTQINSAMKNYQDAKHTADELKVQKAFLKNIFFLILKTEHSVFRQLPIFSKVLESFAKYPT